MGDDCSARSSDGPPRPPVGRLRYRWKDVGEADLRERQIADWSGTQDRERWRFQLSKATTYYGSLRQWIFVVQGQDITDIILMDVENANCKVKVSQCTDMEALTIERPVKIDREITGLEKLVEEVHRVFSHDHVNVQDVQKIMAGYKSDPKDWRKYAKFDRFRYTRNLVDAGNGAFNIMILCWGAGHASAIHDHADSHCFMKMLSGSLEEVRYEWPDNVEPEVKRVLKTNTKPVRRCCSESEDFDSCQNGSCHRNGGNTGEDNEEAMCEMEEIGRTRLEVNDVCYINDALGLHRVENPSHVDSAISLHLYSPPFDSCRVFDARTGKPTSVKVTFTSMYGKKVKRVLEANNVADSQQ